MTSLGKGLGIGLVVIAAAQVSASAATQPRHHPKAAVTHHKSAAATPHKAFAKPAALPAPRHLANRIDELGRGFSGRVGIAVKSIDDGWETGWRDNDLYPQQSVSKLWVSITALDAADRGRIDLDDKVTLTRSDLTLFHQPIAAEVLDDGSYTTTLGDLMKRAITTSDNTANDRLMRAVGGASAVRAMIARKGLGSIRFANGERDMQSRIAGLTWRQSYAVGGKFFEARDKLPIKKRSAAFQRYIADPYDGAAPSAIVDALASLKRGELLSRASTERLLDIMGHTRTGPNRLKGGLQPGWTLSHKTGTGQELGGVQAGYNDIGILTAPDGRSYAVAVMIKKTSTPLRVRMTLMNNVVEAVIEQHDRGHGGNIASTRR
ncbi:serine hydrolase [Sphingomonas segetis]|uniref:serine hydrolase n=1 Tax=Sphingomonas segetis TaxID=1104779 RepID=UPI0012D35C5A|nr:serine hydrolase [Sphingomonas segetis]